MSAEPVEWSTTASKVNELIKTLADRAEAEKVPVNGTVNGAVHQFASRQGCPPEKYFIIVFLLTAELADREAKRQGYANQYDRAAKQRAAKPSDSVGLG